MPDNYHIFWLSAVHLYSFNSSCHHSPTKHENPPSRRCSMRLSPPFSHASRLSSGCWVLSIVDLSNTSHLLKSCKHHRVHCTSSQPENMSSSDKKLFLLLFFVFFSSREYVIVFQNLLFTSFTFPHQISVWTAVCKITSWCSCCQISVSFIILPPRKKKFIGKSATNTFPTESVCAIGTFCREKNKRMQNA